MTSTDSIDGTIFDRDPLNRRNKILESDFIPVDSELKDITRFWEKVIPEERMIQLFMVARGMGQLTGFNQNKALYDILDAFCDVIEETREDVYKSGIALKIRSVLGHTPREIGIITQSYGSMRVLGARLPKEDKFNLLDVSVYVNNNSDKYIASDGDAIEVGRGAKLAVARSDKSLKELLIGDIAHLLGIEKEKMLEGLQKVFFYAVNKDKQKIEQII